MAVFAGPVQDLIDELGRLPGVGPKSAQRIAYHILKISNGDAARLSRAIDEVKAKITFCQRCFNIAEGAECGICQDPSRDHAMVCVVEESRDIVAFERTREFRGRYHVLQGAISPIEGIGPERCELQNSSRASQARASTKSSWRPIPISKAKRPRCTWLGFLNHWVSR